MGRGGGGRLQLQGVVLFARVLGKADEACNGRWVTHRAEPGRVLISGRKGIGAAHVACQAHVAHDLGALFARVWVVEACARSSVASAKAPGAQDECAAQPLHAVSSGV